MRVCVCESVKHRCFTGFSKVFPKFFQTPEKSFPNGFLVILKLNRFKFGQGLEKFWENFGKDLSLSLFCSISKGFSKVHFQRGVAQNSLAGGSDEGVGLGQNFFIPPLFWHFGKDFGNRSDAGCMKTFSKRFPSSDAGSRKGVFKRCSSSDAGCLSAYFLV